MDGRHDPWFLSMGGFAIGAAPAAHVEYVTEDGQSHEAFSFVAGVLGEPVNLAFLLGGGITVFGAIAVYALVGGDVRDVQVLRRTLTGYGDLVPWMLRLSMGLPLVGAGFAGYFFSPAVPVSARLFQLSIGFLLLFGLATRAVAAAGLVIYAVGLVHYPDLLLAFEYVGGLLGIVLLGAGRPSADEMLQRVAEADGTIYGRIDPIHHLGDWFRRRIDPLAAYAPTVIRVGLGVTFLYLGVVEKILNPGQALAVVAKYDLTAVIPVDPGLWVVGAALIEIGVGLALVGGLFSRASAALAFVVLTTTLFGLPDDPVLAHVTLFGLTSAVFTMGSGPLAIDRLLSEHISRLGSRTSPEITDL